MEGSGNGRQGIDPKSLTVPQRINLLVRALDGAKRTNEALASCSDAEAMLDVLLGASSKLGLGLTREQLSNTPPIRDWLWWKDKEAVLTIGDSRPRYQQDVPRGRMEQGITREAGSNEGPKQERKRFLGLF